MKVCHARDQRSTIKRRIQGKKLAMGFKDDKMINDHEVIQRGCHTRFLAKTECS
jgi:hypothetical protein